MTRFTKISAAGIALPDDAIEYSALLNPITRLMVSAADLLGGKRVPQVQAIDACAKLTLCGFSDWKLWLVDQALTHVDYSLVDPAADPVLNLAPDVYWTATDAAGWPSLAWDVYFHSGNTNRWNRGTNARVRAVRVASQ